MATVRRRVRRSKASFREPPWIASVDALIAARDRPKDFAQALADLAQRSVPRATAYVVRAPTAGRKVGEVAAQAGLRSDALPVGLVAPERFEVKVCTTGTVAIGRVPGWPDVYYAAAPVGIPGNAVVAALVVLTPTRPTAGEVESLRVLATLGGAVHHPDPDRRSEAGTSAGDLEALAVALNRELLAGIDALPGVVVQLAAAAGALGGKCLVLDPMGEVEVAAVVGSARDTNPLPDRRLLQKLLASRTLVRLPAVDAPTLAVPGAVEIVVVPLVTQDAVQGGLVFAFDRRNVNPGLALLLSEPMAALVLQRRKQDECGGLATDWERALAALDAVVWTTDADHHVRRANGAAKKLLRASVDASCSQVLGKSCPDVCQAETEITRTLTAAGVRYTVRALPIARTGGGLYVAVPVPEPDAETNDRAYPRLAAAGSIALAWALAAESSLTALDASLASVLQDIHRGADIRVLEDRLRGVWQGLNALRRESHGPSAYLHRPLREPEHCDLHEIVQLAVSVSRARTGNALDVNVDFGPIPPVLGDRGRLLEAFLGTLEVASGVVEVTAQILDGNVEVRVTGGTADVPRVTESVAREMQGEAVIDETGAIVLRFPLGRWRRTEPPTGSAPGTDTERPPRPDRRPSVLVVDDEHMILSAYARYLERHMGVSVVTASGGTDALQKLAEARFDVIVTDVVMPGMNGLDLYSEVSQRWPAMISRVIFMTGAVFGTEAEDFLKSMANPVLRKPIDGEVLQDAVAEVLERTSDW